LVGCGSATPTLKVSNDDLAKIVDTNDEWISVRTGIRNRRVLSGKFLIVGNDGAIFWIVVNGLC
jgi:3-oxoacyl-[acyl-carrier-protein] synthase-3